MNLSRIKKNISASLVANIINTVSLVMVTFIVPKVISVTAYSYWQLYHFYVTYIGFFHFGWADGIYLSQGGKQYSDLDQSAISSQYKLYVLIELAIAVIIAAVAMIFGGDADRQFVIVSTAVCILIFLPSTFLQYLLQTTARIKDYAVVFLVERVVFMVGLVVLLAFGLKSYKPVIMIDLGVKALSLILLTLQCKDIAAERTWNFLRSVHEAICNIRIGIVLMLANIAGMLIVGFAKLVIDRCWGIDAFGNISFTFTVCNLITVFTSAISVSLFPELRNVDFEELPDVYNQIRKPLVWIMLCVMPFFYPIRLLIEMWLPQYAIGLQYMAVLLPVCYFECKTNLLVVTYYKAMREEKALLFVNVAAALLELLVSLIAGVYLHNINVIVMSLLVISWIRGIIAELYITNKMQMNLILQEIVESIVLIIYLITSATIGGWYGMGISIAAAIIYSICVKRGVA